MISENSKVGTNVFHLDWGIGEILKYNGDGTFRVEFEEVIHPSIPRKDLMEIVD